MLIGTPGAGQLPDNRQNPGRLGRRVDPVGPGRVDSPPMSTRSAPSARIRSAWADGRVEVRVPPAVGEAVGRHVEHPHHDGARSRAALDHPADVTEPPGVSVRRQRVGSRPGGGTPNATPGHGLQYSSALVDHGWATPTNTGAPIRGFPSSAQGRFSGRLGRRRTGEVSNDHRKPGTDWPASLCCTRIAGSVRRRSRRRPRPLGPQSTPTAVVKFIATKIAPILLAVLGVIFISRAGKGEMSRVLTSSAIAIIGLAFIAGAGALFLFGESLIQLIFG